MDPMSTVEARAAERPAAGAWTLEAGGGQRFGRIAMPIAFRRQSDFGLFLGRATRQFPRGDAGGRTEAGGLRLPRG